MWESISRIEDARQRVHARYEQPKPELGVSLPEWSSIETNPDFADLSYRAQQLVREDWWRANERSNPKFQAQSPDVLHLAYAQFMGEAPSVNADHLTQTGKSFLEFGEAVSRGELEPDQVQEASRNLWAVSHAQNSMVLQRLGRLAQRMVPGALMADTTGDQINDAMMYTPETVADKNAFEYMMTRVSQNPQVRNRMKISSLTGTTMGILTDVVGAMFAAGPISGAAHAVGASATSLRFEALSIL